MVQVSQVGIVFLLSVGIFYIKFLFSNSLGSPAPFLLLTCVIVISTLIGGWLTGLLSLFITSFLVVYFFLTPPESFYLSSAAISQMSLYIFESLIIIFFIAKLKKAKKREFMRREQFQIILSSIGDAVVTTNNEGYITYINAEAQKLLQVSEKQVYKKKITDVFTILHERSREPIKDPIHQVIKAARTITLAEHMILITKDGKEVHIEDSAAPIYTDKGEMVGVVIVFRDISEKKQLEEHRELILGVASHELKNNIAGMQGYTQLLNRMSDTFADPKAKHYTNKLNRKIEILTSIISGMLDVTRMKSGMMEMKKEEFDINKVIQESVSDIQDTLKDHNVLMKGNVTETVNADKIRISQVITNLISNAAKYSAPGTDIIISVGSDLEKITVSVQDFGRGIPTDRRDNLFKPFYRAVEKENKERISGNGLGLYIAHEIVKQNGGTLWLESEEGKGSTFFFTIPRACIQPLIEEEKLTPTFKDKLINWFKSIFS